jgi:hypothetical protein
MKRVVVLRVGRTMEGRGGHVTVNVYIGQEPHPGRVGELIMRPEDWANFLEIMSWYYGRDDELSILIKYDDGVEEWLKDPT